MFDLESAVRYLVESEGSDLHLKAPSPPMIGVKRLLQPLPGSEPFEPDVTRSLVDWLLRDDRLRAEFEARTRSTWPSASPASPASASTPSISGARCRSSCGPSRT